MMIELRHARVLRPCRARHLLLLLPAIAPLLLLPREVPAEAIASADSAESALHAELRARMQAIAERQRALAEELKRAESERQELELLLRRVENPDAIRAGQDTSRQTAQTTGPQAPAQVGTERKAEMEAQQEELPALPRISQEVGGVLTRRGNLILEPYFQYLYASVNRVNVEGFTIFPALVIGLIDIAEADRDTWLVGLNARYGITNRLEAELRVPYLIRRDRIRTRRILDSDPDDTTFKQDAHDFGDVEFDLRYQLPRPSPEWPFMIANLRTRIPTGTDPFDLQSEQDDPNVPGDELPTGTGFWAFNPSLTLLYPSDPVVFFGNIGYLWTLEDDKGGRFGDVDPGNAIRLNFGMGLGLNDRASFSLSYSLDVFSKSEIEIRQNEMLTRQNIEGSDVTVGRFLLGFSLRTPRGLPLNLAIGIGATEDAADTDITFRIPFTVLD